MLDCLLTTALGWELHVAEAPNARSLRNFMMQGCGADMLRAACVLATENGIEVSAPVHDAVLITAPIDRIDYDVAAMKAYMIEAARGVLDGFEIDVDAKIVWFPDRYSDGERSAYMWETVTNVVAEAEACCVEHLSELRPQDAPRDIASEGRPPFAEYLVVPQAWLDVLDVIPGRHAYRLMLRLMWISWRQKSPTIKLANNYCSVLEWTGTPNLQHCVD